MRHNERGQGMTTKLYLPFTELTINNKKGEQILFKALIENGPAYKVVVHESEGWHYIQDRILTNDWVEIISSTEADKIKDEAKRFFSPVTQSIKYLQYENNKLGPPENATLYLRKALSYIIIANRKKAWIYNDEIIKDSLKQIEVILKHQEHQKYISADGLRRVNAFRDLLQSYITEEIKQLSVSNNPHIAHKFFDLMDDSLVKDLSETNFNFGLIKKDITKLKRDIKKYMTTILQSQKLPYIINGTGILTYFENYQVGLPINILGFISHYIRNFDLREYAPPMKGGDLFNFVPRGRGSSFSYSEFNNTDTRLIKE